MIFLSAPLLYLPYRWDAANTIWHCILANNTKAQARLVFWRIVSLALLTWRDHCFWKNSFSPLLTICIFKISSEPEDNFLSVKGKSIICAAFSYAEEFIITKRTPSRWRYERIWQRSSHNKQGPSLKIMFIIENNVNTEQPFIHFVFIPSLPNSILFPQFTQPDC